MEDSVPPPPPPPIEPVEPVRPREPSMSLPARLLNVFAVPGEVFDDVKVSVPALSNWLVPAVLYMVIGCIGAWLIASQPAIQQQQREMVDKMIDRMVEKKIIPKEQAERQTQSSAVGAKIGVFFAPAFGAFAKPVLWALVLWVIGLKVFKAKFEFMKALEVAGLANTIAVLGDVVHTLLVVGLGDMFASASPTLLMKNSDPQNTSFAIVAAFNITTIWGLAVLAIGLSRLSGVRFAQAGLCVFGVWFLWGTIMLGFAMLVKTALGF